MVPIQMQCCRTACVIVCHACPKLPQFAIRILDMKKIIKPCTDVYGRYYIEMNVSITALTFKTMSLLILINIYKCLHYY